jgi:NTE family protein
LNSSAKKSRPVVKKPEKVLKAAQALKVSKFFKASKALEVSKASESSKALMRPQSKRNAAPAKKKIGIALAGGGPLGAMYEIGVLMALDEALDGLDLNDLDVYVGVSAGSFITAGLANQLTPTDIYRLFIDNKKSNGKGGVGFETLRPEVFLKPAYREYARRARSVPKLVLNGLTRWVASPFRRSPVEAFASMFRAIPAGIFDNEAIAKFLSDLFSHSGRTNDFRKLKHKLYSIAVDLDTGKAITFGAPGFDHIPISKAVQASAALPGLFPPVEIDGHYFVDGALKKTLNASLALEDGAGLVICVNPLVPFDADAAKRRAGSHKVEMEKLVEGGLPAVLSQTFRTMIHSRMHVGLEKYVNKYKSAHVVLFEPAADDAQMFFTNLFSYATRKQVCEHAYQRTRQDLLQRRYEVEPIFAKFGIKLNLDVLKDETRTLDSRVFKRGAALPKRERVDRATLDLGDSIAALEGYIRRSRT